MEKSDLFASENTAFSATASDCALADGFDRSNLSSRAVVVKREALRNAVSGTFSSLLCMFALSSVIGIDITSVYPEDTGKETVYSRFLNGKISPKAAHRFSSKVSPDIQLILLWSIDGITVLPGLDSTLRPNHFVPLVLSKIKKISKPNHQTKITDLLKPTNYEKVILEGMI